ASALLADQLDVGQESHLHGDRSVALARLASAAGNVEREMPGAESALLRFQSGGEKVADRIERLHVRRRIRTRGPPDRRLVNHLHGQDWRVPLDAIAVFAPIPARAL